MLPTAPYLQKRFKHAEQSLSVGSEHGHARLHHSTENAFEAAQTHAAHHGRRQPKGDDLRSGEGQTLSIRVTTCQQPEDNRG